MICHCDVIDFAFVTKLSNKHRINDVTMTDRSYHVTNCSSPSAIGRILFEQLRFVSLALKSIDGMSCLPWMLGTEQSVCICACFWVTAMQFVRHWFIMQYFYEIDVSRTEDQSTRCDFCPKHYWTKIHGRSNLLKDSVDTLKHSWTFVQECTSQLTRARSHDPQLHLDWLSAYNILVFVQKKAACFIFFGQTWILLWVVE